MFVISQEKVAIRRPTRPTVAPAKDGPRVNYDIRLHEVQLINIEGKNVGVVSFDEAISQAEQAGLDLVEIAPQSEPPVCKILDYGKYRFQAQKKAAEARKKQKIIEIKEVKFRPNIDSHDYDVKKRAMIRFLEEGDKVKVTLRFRGREMAHQDLGFKLLERIKEEMADLCKVESHPSFEGRQVMMVLAPK